MPGRLSKFAIDATCKEYVHPWTDSCVSASAGLGLAALKDSLKNYTILYLVPLLMKRKVPTSGDLINYFLNVSRSSAFITCQGLGYYINVCTIRKLLGNFNILTAAFVPAFISTLLAIRLEKPSRYSTLCLYVTNIATETLFRMAVSRGYISPIPGGEIYIFAAGVATLLYLYRNNSNNKDSIFKLIRFAIGPYEAKEYKENISSNVRQRKEPSNPILKIVWKALEVYKQIIDKIKSLGGKHVTCPHPSSCLHYVLGGGLKMFGIGLGAQMALNVIFQMKTLLIRPQRFKKILLKKGTFNLALFLGGFTSLYKFISCFLRRACNKDSPKHAIPAGLIASTSFFMYPSNSIALYLVWKALQLLWNNGVENGQVPEIKWFVVFLFSFSTAVLFHACVVEPTNVRTSYWKFLYSASGGRLSATSRIPLDGFGLESHKQFQETLKITGLPMIHSFSI